RVAYTNIATQTTLSREADDCECSVPTPSRRLSRASPAWDAFPAIRRTRAEMANEIADVMGEGAGNAAFCAALAAREQGASVLVLEAAPEDESGGNSRFTAGSVRVVYNGVDDIKALVPDLTEQEIATTDFGTYTSDQFFDDMARVTQHRADPNLVELLVTRSFETFCWLREKGIRFIPIYGRQAFKIEGKFKFWGGL